MDPLILRAIEKARELVPGAKPRCSKICISWEKVNSLGKALPEKIREKKKELRQKIVYACLKQYRSL